MCKNNTAFDIENLLLIIYQYICIFNINMHKYEANSNG